MSPSMGYAVYRWFHIMAPTSFEDSGITGLMNGLFININVNCEDRLDIDYIYMSAWIC
jgi:uncharacterized protein YyaL (SSP411 family)